MALKLLDARCRKKVYVSGILSLIVAVFFAVLHDFLSLFTASKVVDSFSGLALVASLILLGIYFICLVYYLLSSLYLKVVKKEDPDFHNVLRFLAVLGLLGLLGFKQPSLFGFFGFFGFFALFPSLKK